MRTRNRRQLVFLIDEAAARRIYYAKSRFFSDAERADSSRRRGKNLAAAQWRVAQARAHTADIDSQLAEMQVVRPAILYLRCSV